MALAGCTNTGTVNILIANTGSDDCRNARVAVAMADINTHLNIEEGDTLELLNEANQPVDFDITQDGDSITFTVPVVKQKSQKNYTLNAHEKTLADNLFRFRTANINVNVSDMPK